MPRERHVVIATYEGVSLLDLSGPLGAFKAAAIFALDGKAATTYRCSVVSMRGGPVMTVDGVELVTRSVRSLGASPIDTLIVPGTSDMELLRKDRGLVRWIARKAPSCRRVCSVCVGSFLLAEAGLLEGRRAATHWLHADALAAGYPSVTVEPDAIYVRDGSVWSSAGVTAGIDLALALIEQDAGREVAMRTARILVVYLRRSGGQSQYSPLLAAQQQPDPQEFSALERWIGEHLRQDLRVETLAARMHMSPRNFARVYTQKRGRTPAKAVEAIRVDAARRRLEDSPDPIKTIAQECGFSCEEQMRCAFLRVVRIPPREYRRRFAARLAA